MQIKQTYLVKQVLGQKDNPDYRRKLLALGIRPGALITVQHIAPFGDPIQFDINGSSFSLRRSELAKFLKLETVNE